MKKLFTISQVNFQIGPREFNAFYLPYSAGIIAGYAMAQPDIAERWACTSLLWRRDDINCVAESLREHDIVGFSTYVWNRAYNLALAQRVREINPHCLIVMGGPEPAITDPEFFVKHPYVDILIKMEGELTFAEILRRHPGDYDNIPGLVINEQGLARDTGEAARVDDLNLLPSPYITGMFDDIIAQNPQVTWNGTLETNRGCPYSCTFCDWGSLTYNKVKKFDLERVFQDLDWIGENCGYVTITDANFGMFVDRDDKIIDHLISVQHRWNRIKNFTITWAKNQRNEVLHMMRKLLQRSPSPVQGLTVSVQSMEDRVLTAIKRRNLQQHKIQEIFQECAQHDVPVYTEIIIGLPGETADSWKQNFWKLFRAGNHTGINIFHLQTLENAEMNLFQRRLYAIESVPIYDYMDGAYHEPGDIEESVQVVVSTRDIPQQEMLDLWVWNCFMQTTHINGLTTYLARYLAALGTDYAIFYHRLYDFLQTLPWWQRELAATKDYYSQWVMTGRSAHPKIGAISLPGWNLHQRLNLLLHQQGLIDDFYENLQPWIHKEFGMQDSAELIRFQRHTVLTYDDLVQGPKVADFSKDYFGFLKHKYPIDRPCTYEFCSVEDPGMSATLFLESWHFGRKREFGKIRIREIQR